MRGLGRFEAYSGVWLRARTAWTEVGGAQDGPWLRVVLFFVGILYVNYFIIIIMFMEILCF